MMNRKKRGCSDRMLGLLLAITAGLLVDPAEGFGCRVRSHLQSGSV